MSKVGEGPSLHDQPTSPAHDIAQDGGSMSPSLCATSKDPSAALFAPVQEGDVLRVRSLLDEAASSEDRNTFSHHKEPIQ